MSRTSKVIVAVDRDTATLECTACEAWEPLTISTAREHYPHFSIDDRIMFRGHLELLTAALIAPTARAAVESVRRWHAVQKLSWDEREALARLAGTETDTLPSGRAIRDVYRSTVTQERTILAQAGPSPEGVVGGRSHGSAGAPSAGPVAVHPDAGPTLPDRVLQSPVYARLRVQAGRRAPSDDLVHAVLESAVEHAGRLPWGQFTALAGQAAHQVAALFPSVLNHDGYEVFRHDRDEELIRIDLELLSEQFPP